MLSRPEKTGHGEDVVRIRVSGDLVQLRKRDVSANANGEEGDAGATGVGSLDGGFGGVVGDAV